MHIASITLENFKSFRRATIPLRPGFTAITGPNGSGKSNIVDAILFVLGERSSKAIRASRLSDLIFNGGKGGSRAGFASVEIAIDNSDGSLVGMPRIVTIKRMIRRSPTNPSEYSSHFYLNGKSVRLQDVADLVERALLSPDRYNIVQQGDVTRIVEMGSIERRRILDELAGIAKYDEEIAKAEEKKAVVLSNLETLEVLEKELESRVEDLRVKKEKAEKYLELRKTLRSIEAAEVLARKREMEAELEAVRAVEEKRRKEKGEFEARIRELTERLDGLSREMEELEAEISRRTGEPMRELRSRKEALSTARGELLGRLSGIGSRLDEISREEGDLKRRKSQLQSEIEELKDKASSLSSKIEELDSRISKKREELEALMEEIERSSRRAAGIREKISRLEEERLSLSGSLAETRQKKAALEESIDELRSEEERIRDLLEEAEEEPEEVDRSRLNEAERALARVRLELTRKEQEYREISKKLEAKGRRLERLRAEMEMLGPPRPVKAVVRAGREGVLEGILGTVRDLISYPEEISIAVEVAGGHRLDAIVTEDDTAAAEAIDFLRRNSLGRATFLPLNKLAPPPPRTKALALKGAEGSMGLLIDHLEFDDSVRKAVEYAFGDTLLFEDLESARRVMGGVRIVTLQGELIEASGAMTGGSVSRAVTRRKELSSLEQEVEELRREAARLEEEILLLREEYGDLSEEVSRLRSEVAAAEARRAERILRIQEARRRRSQLESRLAEIGERLNSLTAEKLRIEKEMPEMEEKLRGIEKEIERLKGELDRALSSEERSRLADLNGEISSLQSERSDLSQALRELESRISAKSSELGLIGERMEKLEAERRSLLEESVRMRGEIERIEREIGELSERERKIEEAVKGLMSRRRELEAEAESLAEERGRIENRLRVVERELGNLAQRERDLEDSLGALEEELSKYPEPLEEHARMDSRSLSSLKSKIEEEIYELEPVDMTSIEEFERQSKRLSDLREKMEKLREEIRSAEKLVSELNAKKVEAFMEVFREVNRHFTAIFSELANGEGELVLESPERPFEGGLTIIVRPKGKRGVRLEALSGGEKSLTALAFIFALQQYQPSPVYVLDEVDMFLDAVNAEALGRKIREFSDRAQFIVVTLRKATLKHAERVVGVTMDPKGVSRVYTQEVPGAGG